MNLKAKIKRYKLKKEIIEFLNYDSYKIVDFEILFISKNKAILNEFYVHSKSDNIQMFSYMEYPNASVLNETNIMIIKLLNEYVEFEK